MYAFNFLVFVLRPMQFSFESVNCSATYVRKTLNLMQFSFKTVTFTGATFDPDVNCTKPTETVRTLSIGHIFERKCTFTIMITTFTLNQFIMGQSYDDVLHHLLLEWLDTILTNKVPIDDFDPDAEIDTDLIQSNNNHDVISQMEDDILLVMTLNNRKRRLLDNDNNNQRKKKRKASMITTKSTSLILLQASGML